MHILQILSSPEYWAGAATVAFLALAGMVVFLVFVPEDAPEERRGKPAAAKPVRRYNPYRHVHYNCHCGSLTVSRCTCAGLTASSHQLAERRRIGAGRLT